MTVNRTTLLDLPLPVTGTESGTWGDTTNNGLTQYMDIAIAGMSNLTSANFTAGALTIETTEGDSSATNISATSAQYAGFRVSSLAVNSTITVGNTGTSPARSYRLINADATYSLTFKATGQTGVTLLPGQSAVVAFNGTDYVIVGVVGAGSTTDNTVPRFDGTTGEILQSSGITIDDSNNVSGVAQLNITTLDATNIEVTNIKAKDGTAAASIADSTGIITVSTQLQVDNINISTNTISSTDTNGNIVLAPNGTGDVQLDADTVRIGDSNANATLTTNGTGDLILNTNSGTNSGSITIADGANGDMTLTPDGNGSVVITNNGTSNALRITQTGSGNALLVEDSANPDATPFVVDASGSVIQGATTVPSGMVGPAFAIVGSTAYGPQFQIRNKVADVSGSYFIQSKDRAGAIVVSGDALGNLQWNGYDGANYIASARLLAEVDGTPGTNDMPGRLVFQTTADGASSPTERMRIDSSGAVGIGTALTQVSLYNTRNISGNVTSYGNYTQATVQSDVTTAAHGYRSGLSTAAASFTLASLYNFFAGQGTFGAGSTVTNQYGFVAQSNLTGATNNYGFYSDIASGTGRWNFFANGTADNYFAGLFGIGTTTLGGFNGTVNLGGSGSPSSGYLEGWMNSQTIPSSVTTRFDAFISVPVTAAASFTLPNLVHFRAQQGPFGAGSTVSNQFGFVVDATLTGATNNYGFYSNIASGTGRWNFYAAGTADNYFAGSVGIGIAASSGITLQVQKTLTGSVNSYNIYSAPTNASDVTNIEVAYLSVPSTGFAVSNVYGYWASQGTFTGAVTNQMGFHAHSTLTGATNNFGFYSNIASGTGRWNFYANGTADNYFAGSVGIGATPNAGVNLQLGKNLTGNVNGNSIYNSFTVLSDVTTSATAYQSFPQTQATTFTLGSLNHYVANQGTFGAGSTVTNQYGFNATPALTGATNNYGFYSNIASGSGRWNFYANGTAENYLGGNLKIGGTAARATTAGTNQLVLFDGTAPVGTLTNGVSFYSASGEARVMDAAGNSTLLSPHDAETNEWIYHSVHTPTGKKLRIDMEKMMRFLNEHFGLDFIHEE